MGRDVSIAISAKDNFTQTITTMRNANQSFNKDLTGLQTKLNELNRTKTSLRVDTVKAKNELKEAEKQFLKTGEAADKLKLELADANYENARRNLSLVSDNAKQAEKDIRSLTNAVSKSENRASKSSGSGSSSMLSSIATSGAVGLVGNVASEIATTLIGSAYGGEAGTIASSSLSSATIGAAIGTAIAPGVGTAIGALGGAAIGYIQGQNAIFENKDEAFKSYYENAYNEALNTQNESLLTGSEIASSREVNKISFSTLLGGDKNASKYLEDLTGFASKTPFEYDDLTTISKTLLAYKYKQDEILPLLTNVGDAGSALGLKTEDMTWVATSLGRMKSTGKTTLEYLNPLLERGIPVWDYLAKASGKTNKEVQEMVSDGLVPGEKAAKAIADYMGHDFAGNMEKQAQTYAGLVSTLNDGQTELENAMGEGYNSTRKSGLEEQIDWLSGESGEKMQEAYNQIGQWRASLENLAEQYQRDAVNSILNGTIEASFENSSQKEALERLAQEYAAAQEDYNNNLSLGNNEKAQEAGAEMGRILAEAQVIATNEYNASEGAQLALESNKTLADNIKDDTAGQEAYWNAGYAMGQQFTKGLASAITNSKLTEAEDTYNTLLNSSALTNEQKQLIKNNKGRVIADSVMANDSGKDHATGLSYVPYNNYNANLHEGERILTASENRRYGKNAPIMITGNSFIVREEADIEKIATKIARMINSAFVLSPA
jgi:tape measure domain-containing protein